MWRRNPRGGQKQRCPAARVSRRLQAAEREALQRRPAAWRPPPAVEPQRPDVGLRRPGWPQRTLATAAVVATAAVPTTAHLRAWRRQTPKIACASGTSCTGRSGTSARSIKTRAMATTAILSIVFIFFLRLMSAAGSAAYLSRMNVIPLAPWGGTKLNLASATAGATFHSLMTVMMLSSAGVPVSVTTNLYGNGLLPSATHT